MVRTFSNERSGFQAHILEYLVNTNGYRERKNKDFDRIHAMDQDMLFEFLESSQADTMEALRSIYKDDYKETIVNYLNNEITKKRGSLIDVLKHGIEISNRKLELMYTKPATSLNPDVIALYDTNILSVMEEVIPGEGERVDLVIFLNGLAIISIELKSNPSGQDYHDAIKQYREERNPTSRLFLWQAGTIVNFAMDHYEVYMTTKLDKEKTVFLPFNMGRGEGLETGAGNPLISYDFPVSYMWEDILSKDTIINLIHKFIFIEENNKEDPITGKIVTNQTVIFPRFHQLDLIRSIVADVIENRTSQNYLIQHSAGSGKTNSIAWLAHRLVSLHDSDNNIIYNTVIIITDRVVVDRQLQKAVMNLDHSPGLIEVLDDSKNSADLRAALESNTKIIATTIQKFPYVLDDLRKIKHKSFAVIIDEAHSSTAGKNMQAVSLALSNDDEDFESVEDMITDRIRRSGKQENVSMFAFTATPKPTTLRMFGRLNKHGQYEAFHLYTMKQAIEEEFILDVLANYTTYRTMYNINKEIEEDPDVGSSSAKRQISRFIDLHETNITQRVEIIIGHFLNHVKDGLGGQAKAMVVTSSRQAAVKYKLAFDEYIKKKNYDGIATLVAFSGKVKLDDDENVYTEVGMNNIREDALPANFDSGKYNILVVANKYQTGFDQKKLSAMYILKSLKGVNAVQTLSRLNRTYPDFDKSVFVLDFVNSYEEIKNAFAPYYTTTLLANDLTPRHIYDLNSTIDGYFVISPLDVEDLNKIVFKNAKGKMSKAEENAIIQIFGKTNRNMDSLSVKEKEEFVGILKRFKRFYEYLIQVSSFEDIDIHKKYVFTNLFLEQISLDDAGDGFDLKGKIEAFNFKQKLEGTHKKEKQVAKPVVSLPIAGSFDLNEEKKRKLSEIINEINASFGSDLEAEVVSSAAFQMMETMKKDTMLKKSAQNNSEQDFMFTFESKIEDVLVEDFDKNKELYTILLNDKDVRDAIMGIFSNEIYNSLRSSAR